MLAIARELPTTSQVTVNEYKTLFQELLADGREIIVLPISSGLSATYEFGNHGQKRAEH